MPPSSAVHQANSWYAWPTVPLASFVSTPGLGGLFHSTTLRETRSSVGDDSRWPAFFPSPISFVTAGRGSRAVLERVVGPMIVNRFPLVMAISLCRESLSDRHYARTHVMRAIEDAGGAAVQFLAPGSPIHAALGAIANEPDARAGERISRSTLPTRELAATGARALSDAYLVYEGRLAESSVSLEGHQIYERPWLDVGSHRIYFLEVVAIHLKTPIARGEQQIAWRSLPLWHPQIAVPSPEHDGSLLATQRYVKTYTPNYRFPSAGTVAFEADEVVGDMSIRHLPRLATGQVVVDNEGARWPCFFPSSAGIITVWQDDGTATAMPCGSSAVVARLPLTFAACISNSAINERYAPRATLTTIRARQTLGIGVPFDDPSVVRAISYMGNISARTDADKIRRAGLTALPGDMSPTVAELPIHFDCHVASEVNLGTHVMVLAEVDRIHVRRDVTVDNPVEWSPWATTVA